MPLENKKLFERICEGLGLDKATEIAEKLNVTDQAVHHWKKTGKISLSMVALISDVSSISIHWLVTGEGDKYIPKNTQPGKNKSVAQLSDPKDTEQVSHKNLIPQVSTAHFAIVSVPLIGTISASRQLIVYHKEPPSVKVPSFLTREDTALFQIEGNELSAEGLHDGDLLIAHAPAEPLDGKLVIAQVDHRTLVRIYKGAGAMVSLLPIEGSLPSIRFPKTTLSIKYVVSSITRAFGG